MVNLKPTLWQMQLLGCDPAHFHCVVDVVVEADNIDMNPYRILSGCYLFKLTLSPRLL